MSDVQSVLATCERMIQAKIPNLLRLYLNPFVTQTCVALNEMVHVTWPATLRNGNFPAFLANSGEEALSGAIKLARYTLNARTTSAVAKVLLIDDDNTFSGFAFALIHGSDGARKRIEFIPAVADLTTVEFLNLFGANSAFKGTSRAGYRARNRTDSARQSATEQDRSKLKSATNATSVPAPDATPSENPACQAGPTDGEHIKFSGVVVIGPRTSVSLNGELLSVVRQLQDDGCIVITFASQPRWTVASDDSCGLAPDIVVFDESFTNNAVPFGAFAARGDIYAQWTRRGMATFHSTTYQPNTISTMHFLKCLEETSPEFFDRIQTSLKPIQTNPQLLKKQFRELYNPALCRLISGTGFDADEVLASRHYVRVGTRSYFDGIGGVACSLRGHNPGSWVSEMKALDAVPNCRNEVSTRLHELTGLRHHVPAVSGGSAVEHALKRALIAQHPKSYVVALKGGFGGKTLLALTGTVKHAYRKGLDPLYPDILYVDPFAADAVEQLSALLKKYPVGVIQLELIQGVGGVRAIPEQLVQYLQTARQETGVLLFVDEIQTGMFRTGPFVRSTAMGIVPDLMTIGKGTSDMMFPFAITLYSERVEALLRLQSSRLPEQLQDRCHFEVGYRALLNTLRRSSDGSLGRQVATTGQMFEETLGKELAGIRCVREVRAFGLLIGIELNLKSTLTQRLGLNAAQLYLLQMMHHPEFPVLMGYCQYEPGVLKFTPPLTVTSGEVTAVCSTIADALRTSQVRLLMTGAQAVLKARK
ncbi:MAG: aminotransferase class III-fold pyridoxal phosphate-dependent enzyme [Planctomycetaceae bacterium]